MATKIFAITGQSNVAGRGRTTELVIAGLADAYPSVTQYARFGTPKTNPVFEEYGPESLQPRVDHGDDPEQDPRDRFGCWLTMGRALATFYPDDDIVLVMYGVTGTGLAENRMPDSDPLTGESTNMHDQWLTLIDEALDETGGTLAGVMDIGGNQDANDETQANEYDDNLDTWITDVRDYYGRPTLPLVVNQLHPDTTNDFTAECVTAQQAYVAADPWSRLVSQTGLSLTDGDHYATTSFLWLGWRAALAFAEMIG